MTSTPAIRAKGRDRALVKAAGATVLARLVSASASVAALAIAAHALTLPQLGVVAVLSTLSVFLGFGDFGLGALLMTRLPAAHARGDTAEERRIVRTSLSTLCMAGVSIAGLGGVSTFLLPWQGLLGADDLGARDVRTAVLCFFVFGGISIPATLGGRILASMLRGASAQLWLAASAVAALLATALCGLADLPVWAYVVAMSGAPALVAVAQTVWVLTCRHPELRPRTLRTPLKESLAFLRAGSIFAVMALSAVISYSMDALIVSSNLGAEAAAIFVVAFRMFALVGGTIGIAGQQLWSSLTDAITRGDAVWARSRFRRTLGISVTINIAACLVLVLVGRELARIWVGPDLVPPMSLLVGLAVYTVYSSTVTQASYLLAAVEKVGVVAGTGAVMAIVNLFASIWLTQRYGLVGPIWGSILALLLVMTIPVGILIRGELRVLDNVIVATNRVPEDVDRMS